MWAGNETNGTCMHVRTHSYLLYILGTPRFSITALREGPHSILVLGEIAGSGPIRVGEAQFIIGKVEQVNTVLSHWFCVSCSHKLHTSYLNITLNAAI